MKTTALWLLVVVVACLQNGPVRAAPVDTFNVVWNSPSRDHAGSTPLGNGDIGLNAWVEPTGDLVFYISKTDAWGDNGRLLKVGKIRITFDRDPQIETVEFQQKLRLQDATMEVRIGKGESLMTINLWVDANHPVIHVTVDSQQPLSATAHLELWRTKRNELASIETSDVMLDRSCADNKHAPTIVEPDTVLTDQPDRIGWYHHNIKSVGPAMTAEIQGLSDFERPDPLLHRTFGAVVEVENGKRLDDERLISPMSARHCFSIYVTTAHPATPDQWVARMDETIASVEEDDFDSRRAAHQRWWSEFWQRSWIHVSSQTVGDDALVVSRAYALQRFMDACAGRGQFPIKFNGSIFTVPYQDRPGDADYRRWGPGYWWQNTRLPYLSMCASGDFEMMQPLFRMYVDKLLPLCRYRTRHYLGHGGAYYPECVYFWGDVFSESYGWTPFEQRADKLQVAGWHKWEWVCGPELAWMMFDYYDYTQDTVFLEKKLLPAAHEVLTFFDEHYSTNDDGKLVMQPSQALETWWECTNPMPELAGLHAITKRLLALPEKQTSPEQRAFWNQLAAKLPDLPTREVDGVAMLAPAEQFDNKRNSENPELYAVFPFRLVSFEKPNATLGVQALHHRWNEGHKGWRQDDIFMAYLGLSEEARENLLDRARLKDPESRFPAFWGPNYDWIPDQDHGGVLMKTLQAMLLQTDAEKIYLFPAWPKDWDVEFKLHAPRNTTVEGELKNGELVSLKVTPQHRAKDLVKFLKD